MSLTNTQRPEVSGVVINDAKRLMLLELTPAITARVVIEVDASETIPASGPARDAAIARLAADTAVRAAVELMGFTLEPPKPPKPIGLWEG